MTRARKAEHATCGATTFGGVNPLFRVQDVDVSINYYVNALGFKLNWRTGDFAYVSRDRCGIFLCKGDQGHFGTSGVDWCGQCGGTAGRASRQRRESEEPSAELRLGL